MKILLVNSNPVVSRLTALSARKESVKVDEIRDISELKKSDYDIAFVDFESYSQELSNVLNNSHIPKRVLFYTQDDRETPEIFNITILKPFLPSEVSAVLRERKIEIEENPPKEEYINLNELIAEKKDDLAPMNLLDDKVEIEEKKDKIELEPMKLVEDEIIETKKPKVEEKIEEKKEEMTLEPMNFIEDEIIETKKPKVEKEIEEKKDEIDLESINLIDDQSSEENLLAELNQSKNRVKKIEKSPDLNIAELSREEAKDESKLFELDIDDDKKNNSDDSELFEIDSKKSSSNDSEDEILNFDTDSKDEVDFDINPKEENTKILDGDEISNIKSLLDDNKITDDDISLEDVMTTTVPQIYTKVEKKAKKRKKRKAKKNRDNPKLSSEVITDTLQAMPIDDLRRLLLGTKIHITIEFPKEF